MIFLINSFFFIILVFSLLSFTYYVLNSRFSLLLSQLTSMLKSVLSLKASFWVVYILFFFMFITNLLGNVPLSSIPTLFYSETLTLSLMFWVPIMICVSLSQLKSFLAHMLPYGSPIGLMLFLPLIEIFSQLIRPFTLMIRLSTNLSSGHIMLYMFSYFTLLSDSLSFVIIPAISILFILEICISMLQAYIFVTLISLYIAETIWTSKIVSL